MIKQTLISIILFFCFVQTGSGQEYTADRNELALDTIVHFTKADLDPLFGLPLRRRAGWIFKSGNDQNWSPIDIDLTDWERLSPSQISNNMADSSGKFEGWFRLQFTIDSAIASLPLYLDKEDHAAEDIYLNGKLFRQFGEKGKDRASFKEHIQDFDIRTPIFLEPNTVHTLVIHYVDYSTYWGVAKIVPLASTRIITNDYFDYMSFLSYKVLFDLISSFIFFVLFWFLYFLIKEERELLMIALFSSVMLLSNISTAFYGGDSLFFSLPSKYMIPLLYIRNYLFCFFPLLCLLLGYRILYGKLPKWLILFGLIVPLLLFYSFLFFLIVIIGICIFLLYLAIKSKKRVMSVRVVMYSLLLSFIITNLGIILRMYSLGDNLSARLLSVNGELIGMAILYLGMLAYVAYRMREKNLDIQQNAMELIKVEAEKSSLIASQNETLEQQVTERTASLNQSLEELKATQSQLIQSEKMASLGELTAGIAHEIQNPLNFVNNFSEVSKELLEEMLVEIENGDMEEVRTIMADVVQNLDKINHHGNRADGIVKGMLQHSRASGNKKEPTDINALADEYFRLAYHGLRAKDKSFNAHLETDYDDSINSIDIIPQDIGRVILNLFTNAFYAVDEKKSILNQGDLSGFENLTGLESYKPTVSVSTKKLKGKIVITVKDNGNGIPKDIVDKIFQPFFTTKPTGKGTGLGLSMSYDIIKAHHGTLEVDTEKSKYTEFKIVLPTTKNLTL